MSILEWAYRWHIPPAALRELCDSAVNLRMAENNDLEARVQSEIRLRAAQIGKHLFRNNRGATETPTGFLRYGLANDSKQLGERFKSGDLIGWEPVLIGPEHVGSVIARFLSVECKRRNWKPSNSPEDLAQAAWAAIVNASGGRAIITNSAESL